MNKIDELKEEALAKLNKYYGAMFECGDFDALYKLFNDSIDKATEAERKHCAEIVRRGAKETCGVDGSACDEDGNCLKCGNEGYASTPKEIALAIEATKDN